jgi:Na+-translocating ferredoxin:NAD+ oxidoreductase RnfD subunit
MTLKRPSLYTYMILFLSVLLLFNIYQDIFTLRVIEAVLISLITAVLLDGLIIWKKEGKFRFPSSALISGLIIAALIEPEFDNILIYFIPPIFAILSKHIIRVSNRNVFNPAAFGLLATALFFQVGIIWWATTPIFLAVPFGLFIVYKMRGWYLILSFLLAATPLYFIFGNINHIDIFDSLGLINVFFVLFMLTEHKAAPVTTKAKVIYGCLIGILSFAFYQILPQVDNSLLAIITGNFCAPIINKVVKIGRAHQDSQTVSQNNKENLQQADPASTG